MEEQQAAALFERGSGSSLVVETPSLAMAKPRLAHGFRFHPTDEELVVYYLRRKVSQKPFRFEAISEFDIYSFEPWELQGFCAVKSRDIEWHFFSRPEKKYANGAKINRSTRKGFWKATGKDREVYHNSEIVATKKTLVYHEGRAPYGRRTDWVMHEYKLSKQELDKAGVDPEDAFLLCKIYMKNDMGGRKALPFNEEDWENDADILVPFEDGDDEDNEDSEVVVGFNLSNVFNSQQGASSSLQAVQLPAAKQGLMKRLGIREKREDEEDDDEAVVCLDKDKGGGKKPKLMMFDLFPGSCSKFKGGWESSSSSSSATIIIPPPPPPPTPDSQFQPTKAAVAPPELLNFSLSTQQPPNHIANMVAANFNSSSLEKSVPPGFLKFMSELEKERDSLKHALMNSEATVSCLEADNHQLIAENRRLHRTILLAQILH